MKEALKRGIAASTLLAVGAVAGGGAVAYKDGKPDTVAACPETWANPQNYVSDVNKAHGDMQKAVAKLVNTMDRTGVVVDNEADSSYVSAPLVPAANVLFSFEDDGFGDHYYVVDQSRLEDLGEEFCTAPRGLHETSLYASAAAALSAAGIEVGNGQS